MKRILGFVKRFLRHKRHLAIGVAAIPIVALCDIKLTLIIGEALTRLEDEGGTDFLADVFFALIGIALVQGIFRFVQRWYIVGVSRRVEVELKQELFDKLTELPMTFHGRSRSGDIVSRLTSDVENLRMLIGPGSMYVLGALFLAPGSLIVLFRISPPVAIGMSLPLVLAGWCMRSLTPKLHEYSQAVQESLANISHRAQESFSGVRVIKGYGLAGHESSGFTDVSSENRTHQIQMASARGKLHALVNLSYELAFLPILVVGGWAMIDDSIAIGDLFTFIDLGFKVFWPVMALGWMAGLYPRALASAERIDALLEEPRTIADPAEPVVIDRVTGSFQMRNVSHTYADAPRPALTGVTVDVPAGSTLGVVGPTGSGKTTLLSLLARVHEAQGELKLDRVPVRDLALDQLRGAIAYVPQDSFLFSDTYRANIEFGSDDELSDERLAELIDLSGMTDEVAGFPDGTEQLIGESGVTLSGGQRQRTCIARALARNPRVLVLDDALSAVDTETEARLIDTLRDAGDGRTVVLSAHRLATVRHADRIIALRGGRVDAQGTHDELLERSDWYRRTWNRQRMLEELEGL